MKLELQLFASTEVDALITKEYYTDENKIITSVKVIVTPDNPENTNDYENDFTCDKEGWTALVDGKGSFYKIYSEDISETVEFIYAYNSGNVTVHCNANIVINEIGTKEKFKFIPKNFGGGTLVRAPYVDLETGEIHSAIYEGRDPLTPLNLDYIQQAILNLYETDGMGNIDTLIANKLIERDKKRYYVGSIILDTKNENPSTYLGFGTWELWGQGRVPVGVDPSQTEFNVAEAIGGEKQHRHRFKIGLARFWGVLVGNDFSNQGAYKYSDNSWGSELSATNITQNIKNSTGEYVSQTVSRQDSVGDTDVASSYPPFITCYMWKRIS